MTPIQLLQNGLTKSAEQYLDARTNLLFYFKELGKKKAAALLKALQDHVFKTEELMGEEDWSYKYFKGEILKVVASDYRVENYRLDDKIINPGRYNYPLTITIFFMRDPDEILNSKTKITDKEASLLKKLLKLYNHENRVYIDSDEIQKYKSIDSELNDLKHKYHMITYLQWSYTMEDMTEEDFLTRGIRAIKSLC